MWELTEKELEYFDPIAWSNNSFYCEAGAEIRKTISKLERQGVHPHAIREILLDRVLDLSSRYLVPPDISGMEADLRFLNFAANELIAERIAQYRRALAAAKARKKG
jgi:hypothetical protein